VPRLDVPEIMDQPWCPDWLRDELVESIRAVEQVGDPFRAMVPRVRELLALAPERRVVDLCSGAGGPALLVHRRLRRVGEESELVLTDLYPSRKAIDRLAGEPGVSYRPERVDAGAVPPELSGLRTIFNAMHHLPPDVVAGVMADAARGRQPLLAVEALSRSPWSVFLAWSVAAAAWPTSLLRSWRPRTLVSSTVIPLVPALLVWEGTASCLRCYDLDELRALARSCSAAGYRWSIGKTPTLFPGVHLSWLEGRPV
jgi:hypothetical protein